MPNVLELEKRELTIPIGGRDVHLMVPTEILEEPSPNPSPRPDAAGPAPSARGRAGAR